MSPSRIRGKGNLAAVCRGLDKLSRYGIRTRVSFTAHLDNYRCLPQVAEICRKHHVSSLWSDRYVPMPGSTLRPMDAAHMQEYVDILRSLAHAPLYRSAGLLVQNHRALQFLFFSSPSMLTCRALRFRSLTRGRCFRIVPFDMMA